MSEEVTKEERDLTRHLNALASHAEGVVEILAPMIAKLPPGDWPLLDAFVLSKAILETLDDISERLSDHE